MVRKMMRMKIGAARSTEKKMRRIVRAKKSEMTRGMDEDEKKGASKNRQRDW